MARWLLLALAVAATGCTPAAVDALSAPTPQPTRPTLSLPTHPAASTALPHIASSWEVTPPPRTPFAFVSTPASTASPIATGSPTPERADLTTTPSPTAVLAPSPAPHAHRFVVSTRARSYYYCDTDSDWKDLAAANLRWYDDERALKADYPRLTLHEPCE